MPKTKPIVVGVIALSLSLSVGVSAKTPLKFDMFSHLSCKDELVRVDNYSAELAKLKDVLAVIVIYAGRNDTQRGEVNAHLFSIRNRLLNKRSIDAGRIILLDGGFREKQEIELWIIPSDARDSAHYLVGPTVRPEGGRLKKSVFAKEVYFCSRGQGFRRASNMRLERTRHERAPLLSCVGEPLKRNVRQLRLGKVNVSC